MLLILFLMIVLSLSSLAITFPIWLWVVISIGSIFNLYIAANQQNKLNKLLDG